MNFFRSLHFLVLFATLLLCGCANRPEPAPQTPVYPDLTTRPNPIVEIPADRRPDVLKLTAAVRKRYAALSKVGVSGTVTTSRLTVSNEYSASPTSDELGTSGTVDARRVNFRIAKSDAKQFDFEWATVPITYQRTIFVPDWANRDMPGFFANFAPNPGGSEAPKSGKLTGRNGVFELTGNEGSITAQPTSDDGFAAVSKTTESEFVAPSMLGLSNRENRFEQIFGNGSIEIAGEGAIDGTYCWVLKSVIMIREAGVPGRMVRVWIAKDDSVVRRIEHLNDVGFGIIVTVEELTEQ
jgi:hypothetical protein